MVDETSALPFFQKIPEILALSGKIKVNKNYFAFPATRSIVNVGININVYYNLNPRLAFG